MIACTFTNKVSREFSEDKLPCSKEYFIKKYMDIVNHYGIPFGEDEYINIPEFDHGGMSVGAVGGRFVKYALEILLNRMERYSLGEKEMSYTIDDYMDRMSNPDTREPNQSSIRLVNGSCVDQNADAVVNAANKYLAHGAGICGVIFDKANARKLTEQTGYFKCSNELINKLVDATLWSAKGNHLDIPTDCPTRERHGWTGDAQIFFETAGIFFDFAAFSKKFLHDIYDWQKDNGNLPMIAPAGGADAYMSSMNGSVGWADIGIIIPYQFWKLFGDRDILKEYYDGMAKYARFMERRCGKNTFLLHERIKLSGENKNYLVNKGQSYGEWAEPEDVCMFRWQDLVAPHPEVSTAYTAYVLGLMSEISDELGHDRDAIEFRKYSEGCKKAYQELVTTKNYSLDTDRQAQLVRPLAFDLLTKEQTEFAKKRLIKALENYNWRLGTGFLSTPLILEVLASYDVDAAYRLLENEEIPGWLSMPKNGATTIWENWSGTFNSQGAGLGSLNHYSKGAVCKWLMNSMCGINVTGENAFTIKPLPGGSLIFAEASYNSVYGEVKSGWKKEDGRTIYHVEIPANTTATVILQSGVKKDLPSGIYDYVI